MILLVWPVCLYENYYAWTIGKKSGWNWGLKINLKLPYYQENINERLLEYIHPNGERDKVSRRKIVRNLGMTGKTATNSLCRDSLSVSSARRRSDGLSAWHFGAESLSLHSHLLVLFLSVATLPRVPQRIWASSHLTNTNGGYPSEPPGLFQTNRLCFFHLWWFRWCVTFHLMSRFQSTRHFLERTVESDTSDAD